MNHVERLVEIVTLLEGHRVPYLVMGGHAVRYYGFSRETVDYDLHIPIGAADTLAEKLGQTRLFLGQPPREMATWRGADFRRFVIGSLADAREELLEFWLRNHLLAPFDELHARREVGEYGGRPMAFLSLPDLIRSKETERESDWQDIAILEELLDRRRMRAAEQPGAISEALAGMRSRRGFELALAAGWLSEPAIVGAALRVTTHPVTLAFLAPCLPTEVTEGAPKLLPEIFLRQLSAAQPGSLRHLALVEAVRLRYKREQQDLDRAEKNRILGERQ